MYTVQIANTQNQIDAIIDLRYAVLRQPWDKPKDTATDDLELSSINAFIENDGEIIACGRLQDNGLGLGQIRYMAVHPNYQGQGLGKLVVIKLEEEARKINLQTIELQARENAVEFYKSQGYSVKETSFKLWDVIQHYLMTKNLNK
jgi:N-acetylglutamate synthase-like GNAT family acetyltransferase